MSSVNESGSLSAGLSVEQLTKETAEIKVIWQSTQAAYKNRNRIRSIVSLGVLAIILVYGVMFYKLYSNFDNKKTMDLIQKKSEKWMPYFSAIVKDELTRTGDVYMKELNKQGPKITEDITNKLVIEADKLTQSITKIPEAELMAETTMILNNQKKLLAQYYPELGPKGMDGVIDNLKAGVGSIAWTTLSTKLEPQTKTLGEIKQILKGIQSGPRNTSLMAPPADVDELLYTTLELLKYQLAKDTIQPNKEAKPAKKAK